MFAQGQGSHGIHTASRSLSGRRQTSPARRILLSTAAPPRVDVILLSALATAADAGVYAAANRLVAAGTFAQGAVVIIIGPQISELLAREEVERARDIYRIPTVWLALMAFPFYVTIATAGPLVLDVLGDELSAGAPAPVIMSIAMLFKMLTGAVNTVLVVVGVRPGTSETRSRPPSSMSGSTSR